MTNTRAALYREAFEIKPGDQVTIFYRGRRGREMWRRVRVLGWLWGATEWHPEPQLILRAFDLDRQQERAFPVHAPDGRSGILTIGRA
jgi:hypothetical protein